MNIPPIPIQICNTLSFNNVDTSIIRFDAVHPIISGNKWFKLKEYVQDAIAQQAHTLVTFGGAFSNHIIATAKYAADYQMQSLGIIRGEETKQLSPTLQAAKNLGMQLQFVSRAAYSNKAATIETLKLSSKHYIINEGGFGNLGLKGVASMYQYIPQNTYTHIICACGTGTTFAGLVNASHTEKTEGIVVLKGYENMEQAMLPFLNPNKKKYQFHHQFHVGGYAKYNQALINCMNNLYNTDKIPTDFVYTGKLVFAVQQLIEQQYFLPNSKLLLIHSGGLQGNAGLPPKTLCF